LADRKLDSYAVAYLVPIVEPSVAACDQHSPVVAGLFAHGRRWRDGCIFTVPKTSKA
jgi:hypothetical protein